MFTDILTIMMTIVESLALTISALSLHTLINTREHQIYQTKIYKMN